VGSERITRQDLALELQRQAPKVGAEERQQAAMDSLLRRKRMVAAAREQGLADRPEVRRAMDSILIKVLMEQELQPRLDEVQVDESDVAGAYDSRSDEFTEPASKTLAILFRKSREIDKVRRAQHREAIARAVDEARAAGIPAGQGFGKIAMRNSEHQASRYRGGLLGALSESLEYGDLEQFLLDASRNLEPGEFSDVIERPEGLYVVRLAEATAPQQRPLASVEMEIRRQLLAGREADVREAFHQHLADEFPAKVGELPPVDDPGSNPSHLGERSASSPAKPETAQAGAPNTPLGAKN